MLRTLLVMWMPFHMFATETGLYFSGGGGVTTSDNIQTKRSNGAPTFYGASNLNGGANLAIGYNLNRYVGLEGDFVYWGDQDYVKDRGCAHPLNKVQAKTYGGGVNLVGYIPLCCNRINPFAKVGYARYSSQWKTRSGDSTLSDRFTNNGNGLLFGAGIAFKVHRCCDLVGQVESMYTDKQDRIHEHVTVTQYAINLTCHLWGEEHHCYPMGKKERERERDRKEREKEQEHHRYEQERS